MSTLCQAILWISNQSLPPNPLPHMFICAECMHSNKFYFRFYLTSFTISWKMYTVKCSITIYIRYKQKPCVACARHVASRVHIFAIYTQYMVLTHTHVRCTHSISRQKHICTYFYPFIFPVSFGYSQIYTPVHLYPLYNVLVRCCWCWLLVLVCKFWKCCTPYVRSPKYSCNSTHILYIYGVDTTGIGQKIDKMCLARLLSNEIIAHFHVHIADQCIRPFAIWLTLIAHYPKCSHTTVYHLAHHLSIHALIMANTE